MPNGRGALVSRIALKSRRGGRWRLPNVAGSPQKVKTYRFMHDIERDVLCMRVFTLGAEMQPKSMALRPQNVYGDRRYAVAAQKPTSSPADSLPGVAFRRIATN